jgi:iron(III) transport system permease protein
VLRPVLVYGGGVALLGLGQFTAPLLLGTNRGVSVMTTEMYKAVGQSPPDYAVAAAFGAPLLLFGVAVVIPKSPLRVLHQRVVSARRMQFNKL